jgi:hypothetical protein
MRSFTLLGLISLCVCTAFACSTPSRVTSGSTSTGFGTGAGTGSGTGSGAGSGSGAAGTGGGLVLNDAGTGAGSGNVGCSADLQNVTDGMGDVVQMCPPDQGCAGGACVPACQAAATSKGSIGCDFLAPDPPFYDNGMQSSYEGSCYAVFVANTWGRAAQITVAHGTQTFPLAQFGYIPSGIIPNITYTPIPSTGVPPNQVAVLFLSNNPNAATVFNTPLTCPKPAAYMQDGAVQGPGAGTAFHVVSDTPITAYDIMPYGGALSYLPSASLLYPSTAWGTNYYAVAPHTDGGGLLWMMVVGSQDGTMVTASPTTALPGSGSTPPSLPASTSTTFTVNKGQVLQWIGADPTSTVLSATSPIGVFTGSTYLRVATATSPGGGGQDSAHQQIPHIQALGNEYVAPSVMTRLSSGQPESIPYRLLGVVDGTTLSYDPTPPTGAPLTLKAGEVIEFETTSLFVVKSQDAMHPFSVTHYMPGGDASASRQDSCSSQGMFGSGCALGDEDWVTLLPPAQFLQRYVFFTDPTYATTNLVITRVKGPSGFSDVTVDCLGAPVSGWQNVDTAGNYQVAYVDLVRGTHPVANCTGSNHQATSQGQFGVNVWGTDWYASYGYPAGGNIGSINHVTVTPPQ